MKTKQPIHTARAMTLVEVCLVIFVLVVIAGVLLPAMSRPRPRHGRINCVSNLKQIGLAFRMWSGDHGDKFPWQVSSETNGTLEFAESPQVFQHFLAISNELSSPKVLFCNADSARTKVSSWSEFTNNSHLSYFVGLEADESRPQTILAGDRNVTTNGRAARGVISITTTVPLGFTREMHQMGGNIAMGDGSAQQVTAGGLQKQLAAQIHGGSKDPARLAIP